MIMIMIMVMIVIVIMVMAMIMKMILKMIAIGFPEGKKGTAEQSPKKNGERSPRFSISSEIPQAAFGSAVAPRPIDQKK